MNKLYCYVTFFAAKLYGSHGAKNSQQVECLRKAAEQL